MMETDRHMVPRWRSFADTCRLRQLGHRAESRSHIAIATETLARRIADWRTHRDIGHASDLLGVAVVVGAQNKDVFDAANYVLREDTDSPTFIIDLAQAILPDVSKRRPYLGIAGASLQIKILRQWTIDEPRDAVAWVDLSRVYTTMGNVDSAKKCMAIAVALAPTNRFVLRSAVRFWVYADDLTKANHIIGNGLPSHSDPWLLAAQIAISEKGRMRSKHISRAVRLLNSRGFSPLDISELAAELGTIDVGQGRRNRARKFLQQSLLEPTDNSLAQISWLIRKKMAVNFALTDLSVAQAFEMKSVDHYYQGEWKRAIEECKKWMDDEPFGTQAPALGSYVAATGLNDYGESKTIADKGLTANPADFTLLNNKAFACAHLHELENAKSALARISLSHLKASDMAVFGATSGLIAYRERDVEKGRRLYQDALERLRKENRRRGRDADGSNWELFALAAVNWLREELTVTGSVDVELLGEVTHVAKRGMGPMNGVIEDAVSELRAVAETGRMAEAT